MESGLTEQQKKWFASVRAGLARDTGRTLEQWAAIARQCPETTHRARIKWLKEKHGLGVNRAASVLDEAFGSEMNWSNPDLLVAQLWTAPGDLKIHDALITAVSNFEGVVIGERKTFTAFSRKYQFAAARPTSKGVRLGLALDPTSWKRLSTAKKNEGWSERNKAVMVLASVKDVDADLKRMLKEAFEAP